MSGSRERKREERRQRKLRAAERQAEMAARSEARNERAREGLEPLAEGDRPAAVTVGAAISAVLALIITGSSVLAAAGVEADGKEVNPIPLVLFALVVWAMAWGMWKARYWAVLGFEMVLVLFMLASALSLVQAVSIPVAIGALLMLSAASYLFYKMIRALARIQMPTRPGV